MHSHSLKQATLERWQIVFYIAAAIYCVDTAVFLFFASADEQPWNREGAGHPMVHSTSRCDLLGQSPPDTNANENTHLLRDQAFDTSGIVSIWYSENSEGCN